MKSAGGPVTSPPDHPYSRKLVALHSENRKTAQSQQVHVGATQPQQKTREDRVVLGGDLTQHLPKTIRNGVNGLSDAATQQRERHWGSVSAGLYVFPPLCGGSARRKEGSAKFVCVTRGVRGRFYTTPPQKLSAMVSKVFQTSLHSGGNGTGAGCRRDCQQNRPCVGHPHRKKKNRRDLSVQFGKKGARWRKFISVVLG